MKVFKIALFALVVSSLNMSCSKDKDDEIPPVVVVKNEVNDYIWTAMNLFYLYKSDIPNLADNRFATDDAYTAHINGYSEPEEFFESLIYQRQVVDRFSFITSDYIALEQQFQGVFKSNGLESNYYYQPGSDTKVFGVIKLVLNDSEASAAGIQRGQMFNAIDGVGMTVSNFNTLLNQESYTINFATYDTNGTDDPNDDSVVSTSETATLTKYPYTENPIHTSKVLEVNGSKIGYLMYTSFTSNFDPQLNEVFGEFKSAGVQHLVLDLRYNGGGSVNSATLLGSMITGQFNGQVFSKLVWNDNLQSENTSYNFVNTASGGVGTINSLNLNKVYVLTTDNTASASEMIINGLTPYIDVVQIGDKTVGKSQASVTLYDSNNFNRQNANPNHTYAIQPLVAVTVNKNDGRVPPNGFLPMDQFKIRESVDFYGTIGDITEPFLAKAIADITGSGRPFPSVDNGPIPLKNQVDKKLLDTEMYIDNLDHFPDFQNLR